MESSTPNLEQDLKQQVQAIIAQMSSLTALSGKRLKKKARLLQMNLDNLIDDAHEAGLDKDD